MIGTTTDSLMSILPGGWTAFRPVSSREQTLFDQVFTSQYCVGNVHYTPQSVCTQFIFKANYRFKCHAVSADEHEPMEWVAVIEVFQPQKGIPLLVSIQAWL